MSHVVELVIVVNMNISMYVQERGIYVRVSGMGGSQFEGCGLWYSAAYLVSSRKGESEYVLARGARRTPVASGCDVDREKTTRHVTPTAEQQELLHKHKEKQKK